ncbi:ATP-dependent RNA helicase DBP5 [Porphyridium purpureum]|uniref:RNA helicase n=1 Tax=Porphyridium purpureum TaxID=35688 RepID=A0A5J4Z0W6_PORPP|nr:ATP-dependent RNA helicase DBP5 [Porphyridium purpureum]|eukprot:POR3162..scf208_2
MSASGEAPAADLMAVPAAAAQGEGTSAGGEAPQQKPQMSSTAPREVDWAAEGDDSEEGDKEDGDKEPLPETQDSGEAPVKSASDDAAAAELGGAVAGLVVADDDIGGQHLGGIDPLDGGAEVEVVQADPNKPYFSAARFEDLHLSKELLQGVYSNKFQKPSKIQATSLPLILNRDEHGMYKNLIGQAHNGSGKTACFVLGMLSRIDANEKTVQAVCVVPTRELARQIEDVVLALGKFTKIETFLAVAATEEEKKAPRVKKVTAQVVIGTPGKLMNLLKFKNIDANTVRVFVLDEADVMVATQGMGDQSMRIKRYMPSNVQTLLFSATFADEVRELADMLAPAANKIVVKREQLSLDSIKQYCFDCGRNGKDTRMEVLSDIYGFLTIGQSVIFVEMRRSASELATNMRNEGHSVSLLIGELQPAERDKVIDEFRAGTTKVLIATNVMARGIDIQQVTVVINYDMPVQGRYPSVEADPENYLHRIGRTGRFGRKGIAINFVYDTTSRKIMSDIEKYYQRPVTVVNDVEELEKRIQEL